MVHLLIHGRSHKVHIQDSDLMENQRTLCGTELYVRHNRLAFSSSWSPSRRPDWCTKCVAKMAIKLARRSGVGVFRPVMDYILCAPVKKRKEKKEKVIDAINTQLIFDSKEMKIKITAGQSTGARGNFAIEIEKTIILGWDRLEEFRNMAAAEHCEHMIMTLHAEKAPEVATASK